MGKVFKSFLDHSATEVLTCRKSFLNETLVCLTMKLFIYKVPVIDICAAHQQTVTNTFFMSLFLFSNQEKQNKVQITAYSERDLRLFLKPAPGGGYRLLSDVENMKSPWRGDKI